MLDQWLDTSLLGYTRWGYRLRRTADWERLPRLEGRTLAVTGATGGLGAAAAERLSGLGAGIILVGRNRHALNAMAERLRRAPGAGSVETECADLSLMREVRALGDRLAARGDLDVLLNNAGVLLNRRTETGEGLETTYATNLLGHYLLTELLLPGLAQRAGSRVINVSSGGMYTQGIRPDDLQTRVLPYDGPEVYARAKRGQVIMTRRWAARYPSVGVFSMHPGWADTTGVQQALPLFRALTRPVLRDANEGADTMVWLAAAELPPGSSGAFFHDRRARPEHRLSRTRETAADAEALESQMQADLAAVLGEGWRDPA